VNNLPITAKLHKPRLHNAIVHRQNLYAILDDGLKNRFTLITAPAGYGKTTLVNAWIKRLSHPSIWLTLDYKDNDPVRFFTYLISALHNSNIDLEDISRQLATNKGDWTSDSLITGFLLQIANLAPYTVLILDDYHEISNPLIHSAIQFIIENTLSDPFDNNQPKVGCHLMIISRSEPPFQVTNWRLRGEITEMDIDNLRFSLSDASLLFNRILELNLPEEDIQTLWTNIEGWVAGLHLAALEIKNRYDGSIDQIIHKYGNNSRIIGEFLFDELLSKQNEEVRKFLVTTSILDIFTVELCNSITGRNDSHEIIDKLQKNNVFLERLDQKDECFHYHKLFAQVLKKNFALFPLNEQSSLHFLAAEW
jgi:LuxR family transcriptional regulator, maltose regulon positive regulatory protein